MYRCREMLLWWIGALPEPEFGLVWLLGSY
jgi:hypothetical protein